MFIQYEVWKITDEHEELVECVATMKEAEQIAEDELEFADEIYVIQDTDGELKEVRRYKGL